MSKYACDLKPGVSESANIVIVLLCYFVLSDTPDTPTGLLVDYGQGSDVTLTWLAPQNDGGSAVTEYLVERMESGTEKWIKVNTARFVCTISLTLITESVYCIYSRKTNCRHKANTSRHIFCSEMLAVRDISAQIKLIIFVAWHE